MNRKTLACILCGADVDTTSVSGIYRHAASDICDVFLTDHLGVCIDDKFEVDPDGSVFELTFEEIEEEALPPSIIESDLIGLVDGTPYVSCEWALEEIFNESCVPRLGGASGDRGWSSVSTYQRCPYLWKRKYLGRTRRSDAIGALIERSPKSESLEIGSIIHTFLAIQFTRDIDPNYPLTALEVRDRLLAKMVTPDYVHEAWRVVTAYWAYYRFDSDEWETLAVEHHVVDPHTGQSCRIDLIRYHTKTTPIGPEGTYLWDHKSAARFDHATKNQWKNDGEVIGIIDLYDRLKMSKRFGPVVGFCVNILGKQKVPDFFRSWVWPNDSVVRDHRNLLSVWGSMIDFSRSTGIFPRARAACVTKYGGLCDEHDHCADGNYE